ncbi:bacillithiol biosynthesis cysteine-adding enzyme BshC [Elizabethkingia sp. JS20170427COW]|uniref:bacillithiol biosynthesis cysteine-adding enzyme BshC n=1 Tax=Elizabethkingia sp. JS20170427COW TaxID=2583851 RepID=UPI0011105448|nr:bacillithiol biosynthesis cysteine-adding enzyme BshC [Elizabethkingia sp. JS20170427COW]QCX52958.1 bacillithiol biosynthesis cysteine-adding enzyme BshC [Elizabethkingia sp. JS20170427COW]
MAECRFNIDFREIPSVATMLKDYLDGKLSALHQPFFSKENSLLQSRLKAEKYPLEHRKIAVEVLQDQLMSLPLSSSQKANLEALEDENTFTVITGHQLNLFSGPAFFIYKILQVIKTTHYLNENKEGKKYVPVFWMATEDHDFEEIDHFKTFGNYYRIQEKSGDAVGRIQLSDIDFIQQFEKEFKDTIYGTELILWMKEAYQKGKTLTEAIRVLVNRIFAEEGLLMIDGDDARLKKIMIPIFERELKEEALLNTTKENVNQLIHKYGKVQVNPREINLFYLHHQSRNRIEKVEGLYHVVDTDIRFTEEEILQELYQHPERFSPNAVLRPAFQETVLPNIIYIGGNAEIMYWLELKPFFDAMGIAYPILIPRNSFAFISEKNVKKANKLQLSAKDFFGNYQNVVHEKLLQNTPLEAMIVEEEIKISETFKKLKENASLTDITFKQLVDAEETRQLKSFTRMKKRLLRAEKIKQSELYQRYNQLYEEVNPGGVWQERKINFSSFYANLGRKWIDICYQNTPVDQSGLVIIEMQD